MRPKAEQGLLYATVPMIAVTQAHMARFQATFMSMQAHKEWRAIAAQNGDARAPRTSAQDGRGVNNEKFEARHRTRFDYGITQTQPLRLLRHSK
jgi:hypothetical protein